jgi:hypothetical protein
MLGLLPCAIGVPFAVPKRMCDIGRIDPRRGSWWVPLPGRTTAIILGERHND